MTREELFNQIADIVHLNRRNTQSTTSNDIADMILNRLEILKLVKFENNEIKVSSTDDDTYCGAI